MPRTPFLHSRRRLLGVSTAGTAALLAGCLGDDDPDDADDTDDVDVPGDDDDAVDDGDDAPAVDDTDDPGDTDDHDDDTPTVDRHNVTVHHTRSPPMPGDSQYNQWADPIPSWVSGSRHDYKLADVSIVDQQVYGQIVSDWSYQPGILEFTIHDDFYWWSGDQMTIDDYLMRRELEDYVFGGDDLDAHADIVAFDRVDELTARISLIDVWREPWALRQTIVGESIQESRGYTEGWLEQFEDAGDLDTIEDLRAEIVEDTITTDEDLVHHFHAPFEFRLDGSIGEVGEDYWHLELVPEKNGNQRRYADEINFTGLRWHASEEDRVRQQNEFVDGDSPLQWYEHIDVDLEDPDLPFPINTAQYAREADQWGWSFDFDIHPGNNRHFRRAWAFMSNRELGAGPSWEGQPDVHPFLTVNRLEEFISQDVIDAFTDYTWDDWDHENAEAEMLEGGFERNGDGNWLLQEDGPEGDAGEPIALDVGTHNWGEFMDHYGSDWQVELEEFGIGTDLLAGDWGTEEMAVQALFTGGGTPEEVFTTMFADGVLWGGIDHNVPSTVEAPPVAEPDGDPIEYDTAAMADRLAVTEDPDSYQLMVDELAWCANQLVPRFTTLGHVWLWLINDERWYIAAPEDMPERWFAEPMRQVWYNGLLRYAPEDER